jgi:hypothetical protein
MHLLDVRQRVDVRVNDLHQLNDLRVSEVRFRNVA